MEKTCLTEEALAPIGGSRSKYFFFLSRHARSGGGTVYRVHHHRKVQQGLSHQNAPAQKGEAMVARTHTHTHCKSQRENGGASSLFSKSLLENLKKGGGGGGGGGGGRWWFAPSGARGKKNNNDEASSCQWRRGGFEKQNCGPLAGMETTRPFNLSGGDCMHAHTHAC